MPYFEKPDGRVKIQKYYAILNSKTSNKSFIIQLFFFSVKCFCSFLIGREKQSGKRSVTRAADRLKKVFFLTVGNNQMYYVAGYLYPIRALFVFYFV